MWPRAGGDRPVHARHVGHEQLADVGVEGPELGDCQPMKAERARQQVDRQRGRSEQLRQPPATGPSQQLELERPVLAVAEAERQPRIGVVTGLDVGDAPSVSCDRHVVSQARNRQRAARPRGPTAEATKEDSEAWPRGHRRHDATVYSAP